MGSGSCLFLMFTTVFSFISTFVHGGRIMKTIKVDGGDIVDCINMYKQPALTHPLLVNHSIQTQPSTKTSAFGSSNEWPKLHQSWHKYGRCPLHSIPILRHSHSNHQRKKTYAPDAVNRGHQYAVIEAKTSAGTILGGYATLNVWNPTVIPTGFSLSQIWITAGSGADLNTIEAGWQVFPQHWNGNSDTKLFVYWTSDGYQKTGCYDLECPGFVQTNNEVLVGGCLDSSTYDGQQYELALFIQKDTSSGNWWLYMNDNPIGYWPQALFRSLADAADVVQWGGEVYDPSLGSPNQMGSGHFPSEGYQKSSYTRDIKYIDTSNNVVQPTNLEDFDTITTATECYNLQFNTSGDELYLYFGGPGCGTN